MDAESAHPGTTAQAEPMRTGAMQRAGRVVIAQATIQRPCTARWCVGFVLFLWEIFAPNRPLAPTGPAQEAAKSIANGALKALAYRRSTTMALGQIDWVERVSGQSLTGGGSGVRSEGAASSGWPTVASRVMPSESSIQ